MLALFKIGAEIMLSKNLNVMKELYSEIYDAINTETVSDGKISLEDCLTKSGQKNIRVIGKNKKIYLHSSYDPVSEARKWVQYVQSTENLLIIAGGGYYYHIDEFIRQYPGKKIIIVEPSREIFIKALQNVDLAKYLENRNLLILLSDKSYDISITLARILISKGIQSFDIEAFTPYKILFDDFCQQLQKSIYEMLKTLRCNIATEYVNSRKWIYNTFRNLQKTNIESIPFYSIFGCLKKTPALIVSAGPSLEKQLALLKENRDKFIIFAAGSAVNILEKNGIVPHFFVAVDGEQAQEKIFNNILNEDIILAYSHTLRYSCLANFKGRKMWFKGNAEQSIDFFEEHVGEATKSIEFGPSCANEAMDVARNLGCDPLIFIGQDLAYTNEQLYAKGAVHNVDMKTDIGDRISTKDMYRNDITTKTAFLVMKAYFENYINEHGEVRYINCTEGGLNIEGMVNRPFSEIISALKNIKDINITGEIALKYAGVIKQFIDSRMGEKTVAFINWINEQALEISKLSDDRVKKISGLVEELEKLDIPDIKNRFSDINQLTEDLETSDIHKHILYPVIAAYNLTIRQTSYTKLDKISDLKGKYQMLLEGLKNQYSYYKLVLDALCAALQNKEI